AACRAKKWRRRIVSKVGERRKNRMSARSADIFRCGETSIRSGFAKSSVHSYPPPHQHGEDSQQHYCSHCSSEQTSASSRTTLSKAIISQHTKRTVVE